MPSNNSNNMHPRVDTGSVLRGDSPSPSPRSASISLQAAATMNASLQREPTRQASNSSMSPIRTPSTTSRRRSLVIMNVHANDPSIPAPGEMVVNGNGTPTARTASPQLITGSPRPPRRDRQPSLGELHQELEAEQEAQVNRLLVMIRDQQLQLLQLQAAQGQSNTNNQSAIDDSISSNGVTIPTSAPNNVSSVSSSMPRSPSFPRHPRSSFDLARADLHRRSRTPSRGASPRLRAGSVQAESTDTTLPLSGRDESALYQAETQMLVRENQMLRHRIKELERQLSELHANTNITHEPATPSHLLASHSVIEEDASKPGQATT